MGFHNTWLMVNPGYIGYSTPVCSTCMEYLPTFALNITLMVSGYILMVLGSIWILNLATLRAPSCTDFAKARSKSPHHYVTGITAIFRRPLAGGRCGPPPFSIGKMVISWDFLGCLVCQLGERHSNYYYRW